MPPLSRWFLLGAAPAALAAGGIGGIAIGGLAVVSNRQIAGLCAALYRVRAARVAPIARAGVNLRTQAMTGLSVSAYHRIRGTQTGFAVGLLNTAWRLHGVQLGVLNIARNNRWPFRVLPPASAPLISP